MQRYYLLFFLIIFTACQQSNTLFRRLPSSETEIIFANTIVENDSLNIIGYTYIYNGGGVGVGNVNNDGLEDVYLTGNQVSSRLYLNQGDLIFQDVTEAAGVGTDRWATGVAMVDINLATLLNTFVIPCNSTTEYIHEKVANYHRTTLTCIVTTAIAVVGVIVGLLKLL